MQQVRDISPFLSEDRPLEQELRLVLDHMAAEELEVGSL